MKQCKVCLETKTLDQFYVNRTKKNRNKNNERISTACKDCEKSYVKNKFRTYRYGITLEKYNEMVEERESKCDICHQVYDKPLCCDHDHATGANRGLLCQTCNKALGLAKDSIEILESAINYLRKYQ